jgi:hypothetical protein
VPYHLMVRTRITERADKEPRWRHRLREIRPAVFRIHLQERRNNRRECTVQLVTADQPQQEHRVRLRLIVRPAIRARQPSAVQY